MKVADAIKDIEYIVPEGSLSKYKDGVVPSNWQKPAETVKHLSTDIKQLDMAGLKAELGKPAPKLQKGGVELIK